MVAGLATVTPASGFIGVPGGIILGLVGGYICYVAVDLIRGKLGIDDSWMSLLYMAWAVFLDPCWLQFWLQMPFLEWVWQRE